MVRFKNRYITVEIVSPMVAENKPLHLKSKIFHDTVLSKIQQLHGDFGVASVTTGFLTKYCNENTRIAILRSRHGPHRFVTSSLPFVTKIGKLDVRLNTLHVGATLKHSFKFIQKHQRSYLDTMWNKLHTDEERLKLETAVMDFTKTDVAINIENIAYFGHFICCLVVACVNPAGKHYQENNCIKICVYLQYGLSMCSVLHIFIKLLM